MISLLLGVTLTVHMLPSGPIKPAEGLVITKSCSLAKGSYLLPSPEALNKPVITIKGNGITVDFAGAVLRGTPETTWPDERKGIGVLVEGKNITIKNAKIHGYKIGLLVRNSPGIKIIDADCSYNWKMHLQSTQESESGADWMSYHHNETDQWYGYGAAIYLRNCAGFEVKGSKATGGQCGLMLTDCTKGLVWNNDFSFLSGLGIGMFRSSDNRIMHNKVDWCVRGFSYGVYNRGQDSAGILVFEQCSRNVFAYNSVTHGGDGFFLWAGQTTMDTAKGGSNDNLLFGNDFSHAPTNAIEATFSRNKFINNLLLENWHGVWGGYSFDTQIVGNVFAYNGEGIAIEHGQSNRVAYNVFHRDNNGVNIWMGDPAGAWGTSLGHDTSSRNGTIDNNVFEDITTSALDIRNSTGFKVRNNLFRRNGQVLRADKLVNFLFAANKVFGAKETWDATAGDPTQGNTWTTTGANASKPPFAAMNRSGQDVLGLAPAFRDDLKRFDVPWNPWPSKPLLSQWIRNGISKNEAAKVENELVKLAPKPLKGGIDPFIPKGTLRGRRYMLIDEWGPYDFLHPILWPRESSVDARTGSTVRTFEVLGPKGTWKLAKKLTGVTISASSGPVPGIVKVTLPKDGTVDIDLQLDYVGGETFDVRGIRTAPGKAVRFGLREMQTMMNWEAKYYKFDRTTENPIENPEAFAAALKREPIFEEKTSSMSWSGRPNEKVPGEYFATVAIGTFEVPEGDYTIEVTSDDGVRAWLDDKPIITEGWLHQSPTAYRSTAHLVGKHTLRVEHFQQDGYATLRVRLIPVGGR